MPCARAMAKVSKMSTALARCTAPPAGRVISKGVSPVRRQSLPAT